MLLGNSVLVVSGSGEIDLRLRQALNAAGVAVRVVRSCAEAQKLLNGKILPAALFCETSLPDGTWTDVLSFTAVARKQVPVVIVSRVVDIELYLNALENGAADFIVPPFCQQDVSRVMSCAVRSDVAVQPAGAA
jgi:DNA-binding NtrC family response regulator